MLDQSTAQSPTFIEDSVLQRMKASGAFEISACERIDGIEDKSGFNQLALTPAQKTHIAALLQQIPSAVAVNSMAQSYRVSFPKGLPHSLMQLKDGGVGNPIIGGNGHIIDWASFHSIANQAVIFGAFTVMSIASGQYFLAQINCELKMMKLNIDKILEFLYGDKKAELMAEVSFVKYAYKNYASIMAHEQQRVATLTSLQEAKKVAMKDIEFYMGDLNSMIALEDHFDILAQAEKVFQMKESLEFSMQLYGMSTLLELYYAQNQDREYLRFVEDDLLSYMDKCEKRMLSNFSIFGKSISSCKGKLRKKLDVTACEKEVQALIESLNRGEESAMRKTFRLALRCASCPCEYYLTSEGSVYLKTLPPRC